MTESAVQPKRCPTCGGIVGAAQRPLTPIQASVLRYLSEQIAAHGSAPSFQEIADHFDYKSLATVHEHLSNLERKGYIRRSYNENRAITVLVPFDEIGSLTMETTRDT